MGILTDSNSDGRLRRKQHVAAVQSKSLFSFFAYLLAAALVGWFVPKAEAATLLYSNSFESGFGDVKQEGGCYSYSFVIVNTPVHSGVKALRVKNKGWENNQNCPNRPDKDSHRAEIRHGSDLRFKPKTPYWIGWSMFVPNNYPTDRTDAVISTQLIGGGAGPETSWLIRGNQWNIERAWNNAAGDRGRDLAFKSPVQKGTWTNWVLFLKRSWSADGVLKVWQNGILVVDVVGPNAFNYEALGGHDSNLKTGIYWGAVVRNVEYTLYFDNMRIAEGLNGYDLVAPTGSTSGVPAAPTGLEFGKTILQVN